MKFTLSTSLAAILLATSPIVHACGSYRVAEYDEHGCKGRVLRNYTTGNGACHNAGKQGLRIYSFLVVPENNCRDDWRARIFAQGGAAGGTDCKGTNNKFNVNCNGPTCVSPSDQHPWLSFKIFDNHEAFAEMNDWASSVAE